MKKENMKKTLELFSITATATDENVIELAISVAGPFKKETKEKISDMAKEMTLVLAKEIADKDCGDCNKCDDLKSSIGSPQSFNEFLKEMNEKIKTDEGKAEIGKMVDDMLEKLVSQRRF